MSRNTKIILIVLGVLALLCLCGLVIGLVVMRQAGTMFEQSIITDPTKAVEVGKSIAEYSPPAGYSQDALSILGFEMVIMSGSQADQAIVMMQFPTSANLSPEQMEQQLRQAMQQQTSSDGMTMEVVGQETYTVRGKETAFTVSEGASDEGVTIRQMTGFFDGNEGPTILMIMARSDEWDQQMVESFLSSIR